MFWSDLRASCFGLAHPCFGKMERLARLDPCLARGQCLYPRRATSGLMGIPNFTFMTSQVVSGLPRGVPVVLRLATTGLASVVVQGLSCFLRHDVASDSSPWRLSIEG